MSRWIGIGQGAGLTPDILQVGGYWSGSKSDSRHLTGGWVDIGQGISLFPD